MNSGTTNQDQPEDEINSIKNRLRRVEEDIVNMFGKLDEILVTIVTIKNKS